MNTEPRRLRATTPPDVSDTLGVVHERTSLPCASPLTGGTVHEPRKADRTAQS